MISLIGRSLVLLGLAAAASGAVTGLVSGATRNPQGLRLTRWLAYAFAAAMIAANLLMEYALLTDDFSVAYVAQVGSTTAPTHITIVSLWSSLEGSILFWGLVLGCYTAAFARGTRDRHPEHTAYATGSLLAVAVFFAFLVASIANPFAPMSPVPTDGPGPNALLQNHVLMIIHPPSLYLGYVGMSVPFAMAVGALLAGRIDAAWMQLLRRWMLVVWSFLSLGILLGGWWSYEVLGWGGYWAWDPVENASFMPWLTATAFLHSAMVSERKGIFRGWTLVLVMASFLLTLVGTFMTRSGVFNSVHSFTQSSIGPVFLVFIGVVLVISVVLLSLRMDKLEQGSGPTPAAVSKEGAFLLNNLLFVVFTFVVLMGTLYPLIVEAWKDERISVGEPYFNAMTLPICVAILFLMGVGPSLPWGRTSWSTIARQLKLPALAGLAAGVGCVIFGVRHGLVIATWVCAGFAASVSVREMVHPARVRMASKQESFPIAFYRSARRSRRRFAGHIVHLGVIIVAVAVAGSAYQEETVATLRVGESAEFAGYTVTYKGHETRTEPHRRAEVAVYDVSLNGRELGLVEPSMNHYASMAQPVATPAVISRLEEDLYLSLVAISDSAGTSSVRIIREPLIWWLWFGGLVIFGGGLLAAWPSRRRRQGDVAPEREALEASK